ncbi:MAG TPA: DUF47 family protein [Oculatellaceae cyanobacterium]|jgi:uncharacterized protein
MPKTIHTPYWLKFIRPKHDFFELLVEHASLVHLSFVGLQDWVRNGAHGQCETVHRCEHDADKVKKKIEEAFRDTFVTPFDREEIYDLVERMDLILACTKLLVKEMEYFDANESDEHLVKMTEVLELSAQDLAKTVETLQTDVNAAEPLANQIRKTQTEFAKVFRPAIKAAYEETEIKILIRKKQLYENMAAIAFRVSKVGEKLLHLAIKMA